MHFNRDENIKFQYSTFGLAPLITTETFLNFVGENLSDLVIIEEIFSNFENCSGAILSRSFKSKIMGIGLWKGRQEWPLQWLKVVDMLKIFGFQVCPIYKKTLQMSWDSCFTGFRKTVMSWKARQLNTLVERVEVLRIFPTSKLWYKASALPLPIKFAKKFESLMGSFLWLGKLERLQIDEIKNDRIQGGLGLPCVLSKANALFLKQTCRLLNPITKQYSHIKYWLGIHLRDYFPDMAAGPHAEIVSEYFQHLRMLLVEGLVLGDLTTDNIRRVTAKELYLGYTSTFPPPKTVFKFSVDWSLVWKRLDSPILEPRSREYLFLIVNNIVPNRERLFDKMHMVASPNCLVCGVREDNSHLFTECVSVRETWGWVRNRLLRLLPEDCAQTSNFEFINLMFSKHLMENEAVWLIGTFIQYAWVEKLQRKRNVGIEKFIGHVKMCYRENQVAKKPMLGHFMNIN